MDAIFLMGPTAAGKTELAFALAQQLPVEIISVDSAMVYRGMDIGTGKPTPAELLITPHHLINIKDPTDPYSAAEFASDAFTLMQAITKRGKIPLLVGGTMLYFRALEFGLSPLPSANPAIRAALSAKAELIGWAAMHQYLKSVDEASAARIHPNDPQRIQRALEVYEISGKPMSSFFAAKEPVKEALLKGYKIHAFALMPGDRTHLQQRIEQRFHLMLEQGFVEEVVKLFSRADLTKEMPAMRSVGYRQIGEYLAGEYPYNEMIYKAIVATRQLAKRQLTWLRSLPNIKWLNNTHLASQKTVVHCVS